MNSPHPPSPSADVVLGPGLCAPLHILLGSCTNLDGTSFFQVCSKVKVVPPVTPVLGYDSGEVWLRFGMVTRGDGFHVW